MFDDFWTVFKFWISLNSHLDSISLKHTASTRRTHPRYPELLISRLLQKNHACTKKIKIFSRFAKCGLSFLIILKNQYVEKNVFLQHFRPKWIFYMIIRLWCKNKKIPRRNCGHFGGINSPRAQSSDQFRGARVENQGSYFLRKSAFIISENSPFIFSENRPGLEGDDDKIFCFLCCFIEGVRQ